MKVEINMLNAYKQVVVDTNVLLSASLSVNGIPAQFINKLLLNKGQLVFSQLTFAELESRIWKSKFDRYLSDERRLKLIQDIKNYTLWVNIPAILAAKKFSRDIQDDAFIHVSLAAKITRLITGDGDLLCLHPLDNLHIITPRMALDELELG